MKNRITVMAIVVTALICLLAVIVPGVLLDEFSRGLREVVNPVPENMYSANNIGVAKLASTKLSLDEKLSILDGRWNRALLRCDSEVDTAGSIEAVNTARNSIKRINDEGEYISSIESNFANWYSWNVEYYKAVDTTFNTYTVYFWKIDFVKFDRSERHRIYMLEDGTIFFAEGSCESWDEIKVYSMLSKDDDFKTAE